jgi:hypothetical protein
VYVPNVSFLRRMLQVFHLDVAKSRFGCCIYMQVLQVFSYVCCKCYYLDVAMFCNGYTHAFKFFFMFCKCFKFRRMLQVFQLFRTYVASVLSGCFTCGTGPTCRSRLLQLLGHSQAGAHVWSVSAGTVDPVWARKTSRRGKLGAGKQTSRRGRSNARARLDVQALAFSFLKSRRISNLTKFIEKYKNLYFQVYLL